MKNIYILLLFVVFSLLLAKAWIHLRWIYSPWAYIFMLGAFITPFLHKQKLKTIGTVMLFLSSLGLLILTYKSFVAKSYQFAQLIENTIQWTLPLMLLYMVWRDEKSEQFKFFLKIAIALTFTGHALYALGIYGSPPANFVDMTVRILPVDTGPAIKFLFIAGVFDLIVSLGIFLPGKEKPFLYYAIIWGTLTALARIVAYFDWADMSGSLDRWLFETIYRLGHGGVPLVLFLKINKKK